jgi:hypothetical protein
LLLSYAEIAPKCTYEKAEIKKLCPGVLPPDPTKRGEERGRGGERRREGRRKKEY